MLEDVTQSLWRSLNKTNVNDFVTKEPGVYQVRPVGALSEAYIGSATGKGGLRQRIGQRATDPLRYLSIFEKQLTQIGLDLEFRYAKADNIELARNWEVILINEYKTKHGGKLPPGNKQTPSFL